MTKGKKGVVMTQQDWNKYNQAKGVMALFEADEIIQTTLMPLDQVASRMEGKWGCGRLPRLVTSELAAKFATAAEKLNLAIRDRDVAEVARRADVMIRGWKALDAAAEEAGEEPMPSGSWSLTYDGLEYTVVLDRRDLDKVARMALAPDRVLCVTELLVVWKQWRARQYAELAKLEFPGAQVVSARQMKVGDLNDDIPF